MNPSVRPGQTLGASYAPGDGYLDPPRNVLAYTAASWSPPASRCASGRRSPGSVASGDASTGVETTAGAIDTERVVLTGGPTLAAVGRAAGGRIPAGGARHQVVVTGPHPDFAPGPAADGLRRRVRHLLAARARAACCGG